MRQGFFWGWITLVILDGVEMVGVPAESPVRSLSALRPSLERQRPPVLARFLIRIGTRVLNATVQPHSLTEMGKSQRIVFQSLRYSLELVWWMTWIGNAAPSCLTALAVLLAGRRRSVLADEWTAHLAGESGCDPVTWRKVGQASGFVICAVKLRLTDMSEAAWVPADAILRSRKLSNFLVFVPTALAAWYVLQHIGTLGVITSAESISAIGGSLYGLVRLGRWWRNVKPPEPKARRDKN
jgi:hypothetical protein